MRRRRQADSKKGDQDEKGFTTSSPPMIVLLKALKYQLDEMPVYYLDALQKIEDLLGA